MIVESATRSVMLTQSAYYVFVYKISRSHSFQWQSHSHMSNVQQYILSTIHSNKQSVEFKTGERRMDKCWNSIGMGFKCWRQREWRMKFYHLHSCVQCFWLFVLFDWHIPNYDDSDNNSSICANDVLPTKTMYMMWVIAIENFLGIFLSISSTFILVFLVVEMYVMSWINKTYRTISNIAHITSTSQKLTKWRFLTALSWSKILWCECRRRYIMDHLKNECKKNQLNRKSNKLIIKKYILLRWFTT